MPLYKIREIIICFQDYSKGSETNPVFIKVLVNCKMVRKAVSCPHLGRIYNAKGTEKATHLPYTFKNYVTLFK